MATLTIQINNNKTLKLIQDLDALDLIRILKNKKLATITTEKKLSSILNKSITQKQADKMTKELNQMRNEWERNIY